MIRNLSNTIFKKKFVLFWKLYSIVQQLLFQKPNLIKLQGFSSRNHTYRGSLPGTMLIRVIFQEPHLQGFSSKNQAYRVLFQEPHLQGLSSRNHTYRGYLPGTSLISGNINQKGLKIIFIILDMAFFLKGVSLRNTSKVPLKA